MVEVPSAVLRLCRCLEEKSIEMIACLPAKDNATARFSWTPFATPMSHPKCAMLKMLSSVCRTVLEGLSCLAENEVVSCHVDCRTSASPASAMTFRAQRVENMCMLSQDKVSDLGLGSQERSLYEEYQRFPDMLSIKVMIIMMLGLSVIW